MKYDGRKPSARKCRETRTLLGSRFRILLLDAGLTPDTAAQLLHVTPRTIRYWISGKVTVPYAAYRLVRIMRLFELPCEGWDGWHMHSGKLWSPEGFGFVGSDSSWWGLLVRKAAMFTQTYERDRQLDIALQRMKAGSDATGPNRGSLRATVGNAAALPTAQQAGGEADRPNLLLRHLTLKHVEKTGSHWGNTFGLVPSYKLVDANKGGKA